MIKESNLKARSLEALIGAATGGTAGGGTGYLTYKPKSPGYIIDDKGRCIGRGSNKRETNNDPLGHAELIALRQASWIKNDWRFNECSLIVNLEPCTMCAAALVQARMGHVIFGAKDIKRGGFGGTIDLSKHVSAHHRMNVIGGILDKECKKKLKIWFKKLRSQK